MPNQKDLKLTLQQKFYAEKLSRAINDCQDIEVLREIAVELLKLNQKKTAIANLSTKIALGKEQANLH